jgi:hypothetical protein
MADAGDARRLLGEFTSYDEMLAAVRARVNELQIHGERFDEFAGLPKGYLSKLIGVRPTRRIAMTSMSMVLDGLGMIGQFVEDPRGTQRLKNRLQPRNGSYVRGTPSIVLTARFFQRIGRLGAQARIDNSTEAQRRKWARQAAIARWRKVDP